MGESVFFKPLCLTFSIITLIESLIWSSLSFVAILCYSDIIKFDEKTMNYGTKVFTRNLYKLYLSGTTYAENSRAVIPNTFNILMWIYFILSLFLLFSSGIQIAVLNTKSKPRKFNFSTLIWQILTYTTCIFDLITCILFGVDYHLVKKHIGEDSADSEVTLAVIITLLILAAKGFILWLVNLILALIISVLFAQKIKDEPILKAMQFQMGPDAYAHNNAAYDAYGDVTDVPENTDPQTRVNVEITNNNWFNSLTEKNNRLSNVGSIVGSLSVSSDNNDVMTTTSTWSRLPRTRVNSFVQPRSLAASMNPSPIPPPTIDDYDNGSNYQVPYESKSDDRFSNGYKSDIGTYENDSDDDDVMNSPSYLSVAVPTPRRFTLHEPEPDYN